MQKNIQVLSKYLWNPATLQPGFIIVNLFWAKQNLIQSFSDRWSDFSSIVGD